MLTVVLTEVLTLVTLLLRGALNTDSVLRVQWRHVSGHVIIIDVISYRFIFSLMSCRYLLETSTPPAATAPLITGCNAAAYTLDDALDACVRDVA
jgi:hypothetical protein